MALDNPNLEYATRAAVREFPLASSLLEKVASLAAFSFLRGIDHCVCLIGAAIEALMLVAEHGGDTMLPRIDMIRALYPEEPVTGPRKKAKKYKIVG